MTDADLLVRAARAEAVVEQLRAALAATDRRLSDAVSNGLVLAGQLSYVFTHDIPETERKAKAALLQQLSEQTSTLLNVQAHWGELHRQLTEHRVRLHGISAETGQTEAVDERLYWKRAVGLVADLLETLPADQFDERRQKMVAILKNAAVEHRDYQEVPA